VRNVFDYSNAEGFPQRGLRFKSFTTETQRHRENQHPGKICSRRVLQFRRFSLWRCGSVVK